MRSSRAALPLLFTFAAACQPPPAELAIDPVATRCQVPAGFVGVCGGRFVRDGEPFPIVGVNAYYLQQEASRELAGGAASSATVDEVLGELAAIGATTVRAWAFNDYTDDPVAIQPRAGELNEAGLRGLDHLIARAEQRGLKLILTLSNYWADYGGVDQYLRWNGLPVGRPEDRGRFFEHPAARAHFRAHIQRLMKRRNGETGRLYAEEPAVLGWELMNEPRGWGTTSRAVAAWVAEMAGALRAAGVEQLIGTGESGYDDLAADGSSARADIDSTIGAWALDGSEGISFRRDTALVDFASAHCYPELWNVDQESSARACEAWLRLHGRLASALGRPLVCSEIGLINRELFSEGHHPLSERRAIYSGWLDLAAAREVAGLLLWLYIPDDRPEGWDRFSFGWRAGTDPSDPRNRYVDLLRSHAARISANPP